MKIVAMIGSPRADSRSTLVVNQILKGAEEAGHEVVRYNVNRLNMKGCQACYYCKTHESDCIIKDDLQPFWKDLHEAGVLLVSGVDYMSHVNGPMITFLNRFYCTVDKDFNSRLTPGMKLIGVFAQGRPANDEYMAERYNAYLSHFLRRKMELAGKFIIGGDTDLAEGGKIMTEAYDLGKSL